MKKGMPVFFAFILTLNYAFGQTRTLIYTLPKPDLRWGIPNAVLVSPDNRYFLVSYDYNPSIADLYEFNGFKRLKRFKIRGHVYLSTSFFYSNNSQLYIDIGKRINIGKEKVNYLLFDLRTDEKRKVKCEDGPKGCEYPIGNNDNYILREYTTIDKSLLFKIEKKQVDIYRLQHN